MNDDLDEIDRRILRILQQDASLSVDRIAEEAILSRNACWRRVKRMEENGVIRARVALVDPEALGLGLAVIVMIRTNAHEPEWLGRFDRAVRAMPQIVGAYRMTGDLDYMLRVRVGSVADYDRFYRDLVNRVPVADISASFVMEEIRETTALPV